MSVYTDVAASVLAEHAMRDHWQRTGEQITPWLAEAAERGHREGDRYQGWANRETWALMLHIGNNEGLYKEFRDLAASAKPATVQDAVKDRVEELLDPEYWAEAGLALEVAMMMREVGSLWRVDWTEVAAYLLED